MALDLVLMKYIGELPANHTKKDCSEWKYETVDGRLFSSRLLLSMHTHAPGDFKTDISIFPKMPVERYKEPSQLGSKEQNKQDRDQFQSAAESARNRAREALAKAAIQYGRSDDGSDCLAPLYLREHHDPDAKPDPLLEIFIAMLGKDRVKELDQLLETNCGMRFRQREIYEITAAQAIALNQCCKKFALLAAIRRADELTCIVIEKKMEQYYRYRPYYNQKSRSWGSELKLPGRGIAVTGVVELSINKRIQKQFRKEQQDQSPGTENRSD